MDPRGWKRSDKRRTLIAMGISVAFHAFLFAVLTLDVPFVGSEDSNGSSEVRAPNPFQARSIELVDLGTAPPGTESEVLETTSAEVPAEEPGALFDDTEFLARPLPVRTSGVSEMNLALAEAVTRNDLRLTDARRGVVLREGATTTDGRGVVFQPASEAAREAGRRGGGGLGGLDGIGVILGGGGDDPVCKPVRPPVGGVPGTIGGSGQFRRPTVRPVGGLVERLLPTRPGGR